MRTIPAITAMLGATLLLDLSGSASAQNVCPEGRTLSGACVKPDLAQAMRKSTIVDTQPKLSFISPPVLPSEDYDYRRPPDFGEILRLWGSIAGGPRR
jgi:hypothetical protein